MLYVWIALGVLGAVVVLFGLLLLVMSILGKNIPVEHTATSFIIVGAAPDKVFEAIADVESHPSWAASVTRVHMLPDKDGMQQARVHMGRISSVLLRTRSESPKLLERTITDEGAPFTGTWLYRLAPVRASVEGREGTEVRLTETGRITSAMARGMMKHIFGYHKYTHAHLESLARKFGTAAKAHRA